MEELEAHGRKLRLVGGRCGGYCELYLVANDEIIGLGGGSSKTIIPNLLMAFIPGRDRKHFTIQDMELFRIFALLGPPSVVAGREREDGGIELIYIGTYGDVKQMVTLSPEDIKEWIKKLERFL